jgi:uncharacterized protein YceH (UPF0502 family)
MYGFESNEELETTLRELIERDFAAPLPRRPGERGQRYGHLLEGEGEAAPEAPGQPAEAPAAPAAEPARPPADGNLGERVERLEAELAALRAELRGLRDRLDA